MRFVHIADVHMGRGFKEAGFGSEIGNQRRQEIKETLFRTVAYCRKGTVDLLLIAGDLFDEQYVPISDLLDFKEVLMTLIDTQVLIAAGNHDPILNERSPYRLIEWPDHVHLFDTSMEAIYIEACNTEVWGFSWNRKTMSPFAPETLALRPDSTNILILHGDIYGVNEYQYIDRDLVSNLGMDYIALGHIHKADLISRSMAYPGSLEPLDFSETGDHGFVEGEIDSEGCHCRFVPFAKRRFHKLTLDVSSMGSLEAIASGIGERLEAMAEKDLYRFYLEGTLDPSILLDTELLKARFDKQVHYVEFKDCTSPDLDIEALKQHYAGTLISRYIDAFQEMDMEDIRVKEGLTKGLRFLLEGQVKP